MSGQGTGGGGGIIIHSQTNPSGEGHEFTKEEIAALLAHLPDGDLKNRWQAIYDSLP